MPIIILANLIGYLQNENKQIANIKKQIASIPDIIAIHMIILLSYFHALSNVLSP